CGAALRRALVSHRSMYSLSLARPMSDPVTEATMHLVANHQPPPSAAAAALNAYHRQLSAIVPSSQAQPTATGAAGGLGPSDSRTSLLAGSGGRGGLLPSTVPSTPSQAPQP